MKLYNFHSSSTSFRVRIALALKQLPYEYVPVRLAFRDGEHDGADYKAFNPQGNVPVLVDGDVRVAQSLAICDYLDRAYPERPLFPADPAGRARVMQLALWVACEIQAVNNLRIERYLTDKLAQDPDGLRAWRNHWATNRLRCARAPARSPRAVLPWQHPDGRRLLRRARRVQRAAPGQPDDARPVAPPARHLRRVHGAPRGPGSTAAQPAGLRRAERTLTSPPPREIDREHDEARPDPHEREQAVVRERLTVR